VKKQHSRGYALAEQVAKAIKPWDAMALVLEKLEKQAVLIKARSPILLSLQNVRVADGLKRFKSARDSDEDAYFRLGNARDLDEDAFVKIVCQEYNDEIRATVSQEEYNDEIINSDAMSVFGLMDSHASKQLSIGEWAGAMAAFFKGTQEEKARELFDLLDEHSKGWLSNEELQQRLIAPVKAMTPPEASPLLPLLVRFCADQVMESASIIGPTRKISCEQCQDFIRWQSENNDGKGLIDFIAKFVEEEIYKDKCITLRCTCPNKVYRFTVVKSGQSEGVQASQSEVWAPKKEPLEEPAPDAFEIPEETKKGRISSQQSATMRKNSGVYLDSYSSVGLFY